MKRRKYSGKEQDLLQKLKRENDRLKRQITSLRKQLVKIDIDRYDNLKDIIRKYDSENLEEQLRDQEEHQKKKWECFNCRQDYLRLVVMDRLDGMKYYRRCPSCGNKTEVKNWHNKVEGIK